MTGSVDGKSGSGSGSGALRREAEDVSQLLLPSPSGAAGIIINRETSLPSEQSTSALNVRSSSSKSLLSRAASKIGEPEESDCITNTADLLSQLQMHHGWDTGAFGRSSVTPN